LALGSSWTYLLRVDEEMQDTLELEALALGGQALLDDIRDEAAAHVDEHHPWDGQGDEPRSGGPPTSLSCGSGCRWHGWRPAKLLPAADRGSLARRRCWADRQ
jgi:hypothetical protein